MKITFILPAIGKKARTKIYWHLEDGTADNCGAEGADSKGC